MKTIKSFMTLNKTTRDIGPYHEGYWHALEDILGLIDEFDLIDYDEGGVWGFVKELKARITGEKE